MARHRLYDNKQKAKGTLDLSSSGDGSVRLQFGYNSGLRMRFRNHVKDFLDKEGLRIVSNEASFRKHNNFKSPVKSAKPFEIYYKNISQYGKVVFKKITSNVHNANKEEEDGQ